MEKFAPKMIYTLFPQTIHTFIMKKHCLSTSCTQPVDAIPLFFVKGHFLSQNLSTLSTLKCGQKVNKKWKTNLYIPRRLEQMP